MRHQETPKLSKSWVTKEVMGEKRGVGEGSGISHPNNLVFNEKNNTELQI